MGDYELLGKLGEGGMGVVYKARQKGLNRVVALKMIRAGARAGLKELTRFRAEAEAVARLRHPNIVSIHDIGEAEGAPYFSLEWLEGGTLARRMAGTQLPLRAAAGLVETLARAVHHAHQHGILHRDLKPSNILLTADGTPKVADFSLARALQESRPAADLTETGTVMGTPSYMAPEQAQGRQAQIGPATDVYALGAILYECLTGRPPFRADTPLDTLFQVLHHDPTPVRRLRPEVPRDLDTICLKCLAKAPAGRYASALALAEDLRRFLAHEPIHARPPSLAGRLLRWGRRNPVTAGLATALVAVFLAAFTLSLWQMRQAQVRADAEADARRYANTQKRLAQRQATLSRVDQALALCETGEVPQGLLLLAEGLQRAERFGLGGAAHTARSALAQWSRPVAVRTYHRYQGTPFTAVAFRGDGKLVATGTWGNDHGKPRPAEVTFHDPATGKPVGPTLPHPRPIYGIAFSPDHRTVLTACGDGKARLWDAATGQLTVALPHPDKVRRAVFSPDGKTIATACWDGRARLWNAATGELTLGPLVHGGSVLAVAFSPDGKTLATGSTDRHAYLWDVGSGKRGYVLPHSESVTAVAFRPGGGRPALATACADQTARLWDPTRGLRTGVTMVLRFPIFSAAFSADGRCLVLGGGHRPELESQFGEGEVRLFDGHTALPLIGPIPVPGIVHHVAASPRGNRLAAAAENGPYQWSVVGAPSQIASLVHPGVLHSAFVSRNGRTLVSLSAGPGEAAGQVFLWEAQTGRPIAGPLPERARRVDLAPDGKRLLTIGTDARVLCWDAATGKREGLRLDGRRVQHAAFALDGQALLLGLADRTVRLVSADTGAPLGPALSHEQELPELIAAGDGLAFVCTTSKGKRVEVRDTRTGERLGPPLDHPAGVAGLSASADGRRIATVDGGGTIRVWDVSAGNVLLQFTEPGNRKGVRLAPDGSVLAVLLDSPQGQHAHVVRLWDVATRRPLPHSLPEHARHIVFHPGSKLLAVSEGPAVRLWDVATGRPVGPALRHLGTLSSLQFARDGQVLLSTDVDRTIRLWSVPAPVPGDPGRVRGWVEALTGLEVDEAGAIRPLNGATWDERRREFPTAAP